MSLNIETAKIITISLQHLHPDTIDMLDRFKGDLSEGPSIAVRDEGFLVNSHFGVDDALEQDLKTGLLPSLYHRHPDLVLIRALARGLKSEWINFDVDGVVYKDLLPVYDGSEPSLPTNPIWAGAMLQRQQRPNQVDVVVPSVETLEMIEAGQTPDLEHYIEDEDTLGPEY